MKIKKYLKAHYDSLTWATFTMFPFFDGFAPGCNLVFSCEVKEKALPYVLEFVGEDSLTFASDFPHERQREEVDSDVDILFARDNIADVQMNKRLCKTAL